MTVLVAGLFDFSRRIESVIAAYAFLVFGVLMLRLGLSGQPEPGFIGRLASTRPFFMAAAAFAIALAALIPAFE